MVFFEEKTDLVKLDTYSTTFAQSMDTTKLDAYFEALHQNQKFMGNVALFQEGKEIYSNSVGFADIENQNKLHKKHKFRVGSITKIFTSTLTFLAIDERKISLSTSLNTFFPTLQHADSITVGHLLNHRSGIYNFTNQEDYLEWHFKKHSKEEILERIAANENIFLPNERAEYSNSNYVLLTFILEKIHQKSYAQLLKEKITLPLGLKNTYIGDTIQSENNEVFSYRLLENETKETETHLSVPRGAGVIVSTTTDLAYFIESLFAEKILVLPTI